MDVRRHTRRDFVRIAGLSAAAVAVAACASEPQVVDKIVIETVEVIKEVEKQVTVIVEKEVVKEAPAEAPEPTEATSKYKESSMLAERVARGELPPVDERVPEEPLVIDVIEEIGQYGGTLMTGGLTANLYGEDANMAQSRPHLLRIAHGATHATPNVLKDWDMAADFQSVVCYMRKGMKWSDGEPLTTADIKFFYEDMMLNTEISPIVPPSFRPGGEVMTLEIIDEYTYKLGFAQPHARFVMTDMAHRGGWGDNNHFVPSHYLKQFHIEYNDKANDLAREKGFDFWYQLLGRENARNQSMGRPRICVWVPVRDTPQVSFLERNPYYFAVDAEGNQLPYIDRLNMERSSELLIMDAKTVGGSFDFAAHQLLILNYATYAEGAAASNSRMMLWETGKGSEALYNFNMNWPNDEQRAVFSDDRFRQALSLAINRSEINDVIYFGNASETQFTVVPSSRHYKPDYASAYATFDLDRANTLLDEMGLEWNSGRTHRQWPVSKENIVISWDMVLGETPKQPITELVAEHWRAVGIEIQWKTMSRELSREKVPANQEPISLWHGDETMDTLFLSRPKFFAPNTRDESTWAPLWSLWWLTNHEQGEEPPQDIKDLYDWHDEYMLTDSDEVARKVLESHAEHVWTIGTVGNAPHPLFVRNTLRNVSETGFWTFDAWWTFPEFPEQWFFKA